MTIKNEYNFNDIVVLKTDNEKHERMVVEIKILPGKVLVYGLACKTETTYHYALEIERKTDTKIGFK